MSGMAEIRYVEGLYRMWDDIRAAVSSPGYRRLRQRRPAHRPRDDVPVHSALAERQHVRHAGQQAGDHCVGRAKNQVMTAGLNRYVPFSTCGQMGASPYLFRSGMNAGISFGEDCRPADYPRDLLKQAIAEAKRLRPYFFGDFYVLSRSDHSARRLVRPPVPSAQGTRRHGDGLPPPARRRRRLTAKLHDIDPTATYEITYSPGYERSKPKRIQGSELATLNLHIEQAPGSVVVEYRKLLP